MQAFIGGYRTILFIKNTIYTKKNVSSQKRLFAITYLYVYVSDIISKDNNSKFLKSLKLHS